MEYIKKVILTSGDVEKIISSVLSKKYPNEKIESIMVNYSKKNSEYTYDGYVDCKEDIAEFFEKHFIKMEVNFKVD